MRTIKRKKQIKELRRESSKELFKLIVTSNTVRIIVLAAVAILISVLIYKGFTDFLNNIETASNS